MFLKRMIIIAALALDAINCDLKDTLHNVKDDGIDFEGLAAIYGRPAQKHYVETKDGYILALFNIPGDKSRPVVMLHGMFDSATGYIIRGNRSLGMSVAGAGYDTWLLNFRGNMYSRNHTTLNPDTNEEFWNFSVPDFATDVAACFDYVLNVTGQKQLSVIGFSEGTASTFILGSTQPKYNDMVKVFIALAPVAFLEHVRSILWAIINLSSVIDYLTPKSIQELGGQNSLTKSVITMLCTRTAINNEACYKGGTSDGIEKDFFTKIAAHFPAGTSRKNIMHFTQICLRKSFAAYDYGASKNLEIYNSTSPPTYDLSKMTMKTVLVNGPNDLASTSEDIEKLKTYLPNVIRHKTVENPCFNHLDFMWGRNAYDMVYADVLKDLNKFT